MKYRFILKNGNETIEESNGNILLNDLVSVIDKKTVSLNPKK